MVFILKKTSNCLTYQVTSSLSSFGYMMPTRFKWERIMKLIRACFKWAEWVCSWVFTVVTPHLISISTLWDMSNCWWCSLYGNVLHFKIEFLFIAYVKGLIADFSQTSTKGKPWQLILDWFSKAITLSDVSLGNDPSILYCSRRIIKGWLALVIVSDRDRRSLTLMQQWFLFHSP